MEIHRISINSPIHQRVFMPLVDSGLIQPVTDIFATILRDIGEGNPVYDTHGFREIRGLGDPYLKYQAYSIRLKLTTKYLMMTELAQSMFDNQFFGDHAYSIVGSGGDLTRVILENRVNLKLTENVVKAFKKSVSEIERIKRRTRRDARGMHVTPINEPVEIMEEYINRTVYGKISRTIPRIRIWRSESETYEQMDTPDWELRNFSEMGDFDHTLRRPLAVLRRRNRQTEEEFINSTLHTHSTEQPHEPDEDENTPESENTTQCLICTMNRNNIKFNITSCCNTELCLNCKQRLNKCPYCRSGTF